MPEHSFKLYFLLIDNCSITAGILTRKDLITEYGLFMESLCKVKIFGSKSRLKATCF